VNDLGAFDVYCTDVSAGAGHVANADRNSATIPAPNCSDRMTSISPTATSLAYPAERETLARLGGWLFRHRGVLPVPFIVVPFIWHGAMTGLSTALGVVFVLGGESLRLWGVAAAGPETRRRSRAVSRLVTHGPFAWLRNPLYFGNFFLWTGFSAIAGIQWFLPVAVLLFALEYAPIVRYEEAVLEATFGAEYLRYRERTPRWLPVAPAAAPSGLLCWSNAWRSERSTLLQFALLAAVLAVSRGAR
jgi:protein-S-isoprenylcysteine O-methyltransferase Ste14